MFELFTDKARRVVVLAQEESRPRNHDHIGTEHLLVALLHDDDIATAPVLAEAGVSLAALQQRLDLTRGDGTTEPSGHLPFTARFKKVLMLSLRVSQRLGAQTIAPAHLLRAMLDVPDSAGYQLLADFDVDTDTLARVADDLAFSGDTRSDEGVRVPGRSASAATFTGATAGDVRRMSAHEISVRVGRLTDELAQRQNRLAAGLRRYGRHLAYCEPGSEHGCTCGFEALLADTETPQPPMDPGQEPQTG